jgi:hypothetical protein
MLLNFSLLNIYIIICDVLTDFILKFILLILYFFIKFLNKKSNLLIMLNI